MIFCATVDPGMGWLGFGTITFVGGGPQV